MSRQILTPENEAAWLAMREVDITSTECSALFGCCPYMTTFELYHVKTGQLETDFKEDDRIRWGKRLEFAIAQGIAEDYGLIVEPFKTYMRIEELRMGASFDFKVVGVSDHWHGENDTYRQMFLEHGEGIMEVKNVDGLIFRRGWIDGDELEAPPHIELQVQHQMEVADLEWAVVAPLIGGNTPRPFHRLRDRDIGAAIQGKVADFWGRVKNDNPPDPDYAADVAAIARLHLYSNDTVEDMTEDEHLSSLCVEYQTAADDAKEADTRKKAAKGEILTIIGPAGKVMADGFSISAGTVADNPGKLISASMVGTYVGGRRGFRNLRITQKKAASK